MNPAPPKHITGICRNYKISNESGWFYERKEDLFKKTLWGGAG